MREHFNSGAPWENTVGYSRAVRVGNIIEISGTVSVLNGQVYGPGDPYVQTKRIFQIVGDALKYFNSSFQDVIRTRIYVTDIAKSWKAVGRAHGEIFAEIKPATSMVEVSALIAPEYLVEIEVTAIVG